MLLVDGSKQKRGNIIALVISLVFISALILLLMLL